MPTPNTDCYSHLFVLGIVLLFERPKRGWKLTISKTNIIDFEVAFSLGNFIPEPWVELSFYSSISNQVWLDILLQYNRSELFIYV